LIFAVAGSVYLIAIGVVHLLSPKLARVDVPAWSRGGGSWPELERVRPQAFRLWLTPSPAATRIVCDRRWPTCRTCSGIQAATPAGFRGGELGPLRGFEYAADCDPPAVLPWISERRGGEQHVSL